MKSHKQRETNRKTKRQTEIDTDTQPDAEWRGGIRKTKGLTELEQLKGSKAAATPRLQGQR